jgi:hypothetical protein
MTYAGHRRLDRPGVEQGGQAFAIIGSGEGPRGSKLDSARACSRNYLTPPLGRENGLFLAGGPSAETVSFLHPSIIVQPNPMMVLAGMQDLRARAVIKFAAVLLSPSFDFPALAKLQFLS